MAPQHASQPCRGIGELVDRRDVLRALPDEVHSPHAGRRFDRGDERLSLRVLRVLHVETHRFLKGPLRKTRLRPLRGERLLHGGERRDVLGTDAVRDGVDVPGRSLRLIVFDRVPWPRPDILHRARRAAFGGRRYDDMLTRLPNRRFLDTRLPEVLAAAAKARRTIAVCFLDLDNFSRYMAVTTWLSTLDSILGIGQNYYVYLHPKTGKLTALSIIRAVQDVVDPVRIGT